MSLTRFVVLVNLGAFDDWTWNFYAPYLFATLEVHLGIVCACLPTLRPLVQSAYSKARVSMGYPSTSAEPAWSGPGFSSKKSASGSDSEPLKQEMPMHSYSILVDRPSKASIADQQDRAHPGRLANPNDLSFWRVDD
jgi:hypothetical protein